MIAAFTFYPSQFLALTSGASREEILLAFIEAFNFIVAVVALYFAVRILPAISRDARKRSWLFLSLAVIMFALAETIGVIKEIANVDLEVFYDITESVFTVLLATGFYYLFTTEFKEMINLRHQTTTDQLTSLYSPAFFDAYLQKRVASVSGEDAQLSVLFLSVDDFEEYRARHGRLEAEYVLKKVAAIIQEETREEGEKGDEVACRYGAERFTLLLGAGFGAAGNIAERLRYSIKMECSTFSDLRMKQNVTTSIGLASYGRDAVIDTELIAIAETRMVEAVRQGKNRVFAGEVELQPTS